MKTILLTGGSGFIGKNIQELYYCPIIAPSHKELNLLDQDSVKRYLTDIHPDIIIHTATVHDVPEALDVNTRMYQNLYRNSHLFGRMINFSSGAAYGTYRNIINAKESDLSEFIPTNPYGYSKYLNSQFTYTTDNIVDLYLFGVFGKYEIESRFIPSIVRAALEGNNPTVYKDRKMSYIWVNDLMPIIDYFVNCATSKLGQAYNITNQVINLVALAHLALNCIHRSKDSLYILSSEKAHEYTGCGDLIKLVNPFVEFTPLEEALRYYIEKEFT